MFWKAIAVPVIAFDVHAGPQVDPACMVAVELEDNTRVMGALVATLMIGCNRFWYAERRLAGPPPHSAEGQD